VEEEKEEPAQPPQLEREPARLPVRPKVRKSKVLIPETELDEDYNPRWGETIKMRESTGVMPTDLEDNPHWGEPDAGILAEKNG